VERDIYKAFKDYFFKTIIICDECSGLGFKKSYSYGPNGKEKIKLCEKCDGEGKVVQVTLNIKYEVKLSDPLVNELENKEILEKLLVEKAKKILKTEG